MAGRNSVLKPKAPQRDGPTHLVMSPLEFMRRLVSLVPPSAARRRPCICECR